MLYKFKSKATGDVIMLGPQGDQMLRILGREPAHKGIIEPASAAQAIRALQDAIAAEEAAQREATAAGGDDREHAPGVALRQRLWPMIEMLQRAQAANEPVVWGV